MPNGDTTPADPVDSNGGWMSDVQRALALLIIGSLVLATTALIIRLTISADIKDVVDIAKIMLAALVNMGLVALGFFFGNTSAKMQSDAGQQKVVEKLTSTAPPGPTGPVAPLPSPVVVIAWWSKLTDAERAAISATAPTDPKVAAFMAAAQTGAATKDDLAALVTKGLLTQERATAIGAA